MQAQAAPPLYTEAEIEQIISREEGDFRLMISMKQTGDRAFIARGTRLGNGVIMVGQAGDWTRGMTCYGPGYAERAAEYVRRFNALTVQS